MDISKRLVGTLKKLVGTRLGKIVGRAEKLVGAVASHIERKSIYSENVWKWCTGASIRLSTWYTLVTRRTLYQSS